MAVLSNSPQIAALRKAVEEKFAHSVDSRLDFTMLGTAIENVTNEHIAENTLRRLWGKLKTYDTVFTSTLDVLSRYAGFNHWNHFCQELRKQGRIESSIIKDGKSIEADDLKPGDLIRFFWLPDRECTVRYSGARKFTAVESKNATIQAGDSFECGTFIKGHPLFVDNFTHDGELCKRYSIGTENGLTELEKL